MLHHNHSQDIETTSRNTELPHAYPVANNYSNVYRSVYNHNSHTHINLNHSNAHDDQESLSESKKCDAKICIKRVFRSVFVIIILLNVALITLVFMPSKKDKDTNETFFDTAEVASPNDNDTSSIHNMTTPTINNITEPTDQNTNTTAAATTTKNQTCYTDPMAIQTIEWEAYLRGDDPSIPRTYYICAHTTMNVFEFDPIKYKYIFTSGDVLPLFIFTPNVHIKCEQNCTFNGGNLHILLLTRPCFINYSLNNTTPENVTIDGFRFTNSKEGTSIHLATDVSSITVKNCRFDNNYNMMSSINLVQTHLISSSIQILDSTFESNTYSTNTGYYDQYGVWKTLPLIGIVLTWTNTTAATDHIMKNKISTHVRNTLFFNNTFLIDIEKHQNDKNKHINNNDNITTLLEQQQQQDAGIDYYSSSYLNAAIINLFPPVTHLEVSDSCFVENTGYTSGLIQVAEEHKHEQEEEGEEDGEKNEDQQLVDQYDISQEYFGNSFIQNRPHSNDFSDDDTITLSCIVSFQDIEYRGNDYAVSTSLKDSCMEYIEEEQQQGKEEELHGKVCGI